MTVEGFDPPDRLRRGHQRIEGPLLALLLHHDGCRQKIRQALRDADRTRTWSPTAMRGGEGLVQVQVDDVHPEIARAGHAGQRVHVGPVPVDQPPAAMDQLDDLHHMLLKEAERVGIGQHQASHRLITDLLHGIEVHIAAIIRRQLDHLQPTHGSGGGVGSVSRVGNQDFGPLLILPITMIGLDHKDARELPVGACGRLQGRRGKPADLLKPFLQFVHQLQVALHGFDRLQRMGEGEPWKPRRVLVHLGIVFHRAGAQRVEAGVHGMIQLREAHEVADRLKLRNLRQIQRLAHKAIRKLRLRHIRSRQGKARPAGGRQIINQRLRHGPPPPRPRRSDRCRLCCWSL